MFQKIDKKWMFTFLKSLFYKNIAFTVVMKFDPQTMDMQFMWNISLSHHQGFQSFYIKFNFKHGPIMNSTLNIGYFQFC